MIDIISVIRQGKRGKGLVTLIPEQQASRLRGPGGAFNSSHVPGLAVSILQQDRKALRPLAGGTPAVP